MRDGTKISIWTKECHHSLTDSVMPIKRRKQIHSYHQKLAALSSSTVVLEMNGSRSVSRWIRWTLGPHQGFTFLVGCACSRYWSVLASPKWITRRFAIDGWLCFLLKDFAHTDRLWTSWNWWLSSPSGRKMLKALRDPCNHLCFCNREWTNLSCIPENLRHSMATM